MKAYGPQDIRNVALIGHGGTGKTSFASAMLHTAKAVNRFGKVEEGTAPTDYEEDEIQRKLSISSSLAFVEWEKAKINILDTPGYGSFIADSRGPIRVSDSALIFVSAVSGVEVMTGKAWEYAEEFNVPRILVINKMDRENASFDRSLASIRENFGRLAVPVFLPLGQEREFAGVVDLVRGKAHRYAQDESGACTEEEVPAPMAEEVAKARAELVEMVAELDEKLMEKYFEAGDLTPEELSAALRIGIAQDKIFPVLCASALRNIGVADIMNFLVEFAPPANARSSFRAAPMGGGEEFEVPADVDAPASAFVFKTISDPAQGRITIFRVVSGRVPADATLINPSKDAPERMAGLFHLRGKDHVKCEEAQAGDIAAVMKLKETVTGNTLCAKERMLIFPPVKYPIPAISFAVEPKSRGDEDKIMAALQRMVDEDPNLTVGRDPQTHETLVSGSGSQHVEVVAARVQRRYGVEMNIKQPKVPYRETIKGRAEVHARHKKQTGGHGQFADIQIKMEPLPRGTGFEFKDEIFGGAVPRNFIPAVEKGMLESLDRGVLARYPVVDLRITLFDGGFHPVDSSEMAFKIAAHMGFKEAMEKCKPTLLEPVMLVEVVVPEENMGDVMGDLNSRRGRIQGMSQKGANQIIKAQVPLAEMLTYASTLKSLTAGRGTFSMEFAAYEEVPAQTQQKIVEEAKQAKEAEQE
ncbi:MAG: elongation factor G [Acidobacteriota bacterium]